MMKMIKNETQVGAAQKGRGCGVEKGLQPTKKLFLCHNTVHSTISRSYPYTFACNIHP